VLATGGLGQLYRHTTNPLEADGSGYVLAQQAGAELADMEFVQFHPTALATRMEQDAQLPLISEALRGYGARLVNDRGVRFMAAQHELAELAPMDVVARGVFMQMEQGHEVFLDARALGEAVRTIFPTVFAACKTRNIDPRIDLVPIVPAAHFMMGGVKVDLHASSSVQGLYAVGEVACSGAHGANRIAGNALLESISFGRVLGARLARQPSVAQNLRDDGSVSARRTASAPVSDSLVYNRLKNLMWSFVGIVRSEEGLQGALEQIQLLERRCLSGSKALNQLLLARIVIEAALHRKNSNGAHFLQPGRALGLGNGSAVA
jgi:L-aspartate oxidase